MKQTRRIPSTFFRFFSFLLVLICLVVILSVTQYLNLQSARMISSVDSLSGQRVGCCSGWETDLLLTGRDDLTLLRYNTNADAIMALGYGQIDAFGADEATTNSILLISDGLEALPDPLTRIGCTQYTSLSNETVLNEFNEFAAAFVDSDDYEDFHNRAVMADGNPYVLPDIPTVTDGKILRVGYIPLYYPQCFWDTVNGLPSGYSIEIVKLFALQYGYTVEFVETSEESFYIGLLNGTLDIVACGATDVYREAVETSGVAHMTEAYLYADVLLLRLKEGAKLVLKGDISS